MVECLQIGRGGLTRRGALALTGALVACPGVLRSQTATPLRIGHGLPATHPVHAAMQFFADQLREKSGGALEATIFPDGVIGQEVNLLSQAQAGKLDFVKASASVLEAIGPAYRAFNLPSAVFRDRAHWRTITTNAVGERILASTESKGLVGLTYYDAGSRGFYARKPINHPDDLKGLKIRIQPSPTMNRLMQLFGAEGVALDWEHVYNALRTRLVDGAENSISALIVGRHAEAVTHYSFDEHTMVPDVFLVSAARWATFTPVQQGFVREAARASYHRMNTLWEAFQADMQKRMRDHGRHLYVFPIRRPSSRVQARSKNEFASDVELMRTIEPVRAAPEVPYEQKKPPREGRLWHFRAFKHHASYLSCLARSIQRLEARLDAVPSVLY